MSIDNIGLGYKNAEDAAESCKKWFPYNKGGGFKNGMVITNMLLTGKIMALN